MEHSPIYKKCSSNKSVKNGHNRCGTQWYNVKNVKQCLHGNMKKKSKLPKNKEKRKIIDCYAEGMGLNSICRVFKVGINSIQTRR